MLLTTRREIGTRSVYRSHSRTRPGGAPSGPFLHPDVEPLSLALDLTGYLGNLLSLRLKRLLHEQRLELRPLHIRRGSHGRRRG